MVIRRIPLENGEVYHIFSKSIVGFTIFRNDEEYDRMKNLLKYYIIEKPSLRFSAFLEIKNRDKFLIEHFGEKNKLVEIMAYCFMPTHFHLVLKQLKDNGISIFMGNILNSYTRYFNRKIKRKGPLWESRFKNVLIATDEQLWHLTRYIHLNPVTASIVNIPQAWNHSSYKEFLRQREPEECLCKFSELMRIDIHEYREFVNSNIDYQRELSEIKQLFID